MTTVAQAEYTIFIVYIDVVTDVVSVWLLYLVHDFFLDHFIFLYLDVDPFVHLFNFLSHDIDCDFLFLENQCLVCPVVTSLALLAAVVSPVGLKIADVSIAQMVEWKVGSGV